MKAKSLPNVYMQGKCWHGIKGDKYQVCQNNAEMYRVSRSDLVLGVEVAMSLCEKHVKSVESRGYIVTKVPAS